MSRVAATLTPRTSSHADVEKLQAMLAAETSRREQLEREVSNVRSTLERAQHLALHDGLTSLPNRRFFEQRLEQALTAASPQHPALAVLYLDLDEFKPVNDLHGHDTGDQLLRIVAARLARVVRSEDMMSRLGGDEFACLPADFANLEQLTQLAVKLYDVVSAPLKLGRLTLTVRPSIGIATYPADGRTAGALLKSADTAMYRAKRLQTGYFFCDSRIGVQAARHSRTSAARPTLTRDHASGSEG